MAFRDNQDLLDLEECSILQQWVRSVGIRCVRNLLRFAVLLLIIYYLYRAYVNNPSIRYAIDDSFADVVPGALGSTVLQKECSQETSRCYSVMDYPTDETGLFVRRTIYVHGFEKEADTMVRLIPPPNGLSYHNSDSKLWQVDHIDLSSQYIAVLCLFPFVLGSVPSLENTDSRASIMNIGLGGGSADMFLHQLKPQWKIHVYELDPVVKKIAHRWFGVVDDDYHKTYIKDGLVAIAEAVEQGLKYDVLIIDACDVDTVIPCPAKGFLDPLHLQNMVKILNPTGCVLFNVLVMNNNHITENVADIERRLLLFFPTCLVVRLSIEENVIIACLLYALEPSNAAQTKGVWRAKLDDTIDKFGFHFDVD